MIFVTVGTHPGGFSRLIRRIDEIAPLLKEEIIVQRGFTKYIPKNVKYFDFVPDLSPYFQKARIVITHSATSLIEFVFATQKPVITVPRQAKFGEHINDHQIEFAEWLSKKTGLMCVLDIKRITPDLLRSYSFLPRIDKNNLKRFQRRLKEEISILGKESNE